MSSAGVGLEFPASDHKAKGSSVPGESFGVAYDMRNLRGMDANTNGLLVVEMGCTSSECFLYKKMPLSGQRIQFFFHLEFWL